MNKKCILKALGGLGAVSGAVGGLALWQRLCFKRAKNKDDAMPYDTYASSNGEITYFTSGQGASLLLIHSMLLGASRREWRSVVDSLAQNYRIYAIDLPGFGDSFTTPKPWTIYQYAKVVEEFLTNVIKEPAYILGANGGADIALAAAMLGDESSIKGLMLISPLGFGEGFPTNDEVRPLSRLMLPLLGTQKFLSATGKKRIKELLEGNFYGKERLTEEMLADHYYYARSSGKKQTSFAALESNFWRGDTKKAFMSIKVPFYIMWGEKNALNPPSNMEWAENAREDGEYIIFEETAAFPHVENSGGFCSTVKEYLK